jgi:hypothetical protein
MSDTMPHRASTAPAGVLPQTLQTLRLARASQAFLGSLPKPMELWEAVLLSHSQRVFLRCWLDLRIRRVDEEAVAEAERAVVDKLAELRRENGPWMAGLRVFLAGLPGLPAEGEILEVAIALLTISIDGRATSLRWIADPSGCRTLATAEMHFLLQQAQAIHKVIGPQGKGEKTTDQTPTTAAPAEGKSSITRILPRGVTMETLEDVGRVEDCRRILKEFDPEVQIWECLCLVMTDDSSRRSIDTAVRRKKAGSQDFAEGALALFEQLQEIRKEHSDFVKRVAAFVSELPVGHYSTETKDLALGFIVAGEVGRKHAAQWLSNPAHYRQEAATRFEGLVGRAMNYQAALRAFA